MDFSRIEAVIVMISHVSDFFKSVTETKIVNKYAWALAYHELRSYKYGLNSLDYGRNPTEEQLQRTEAIGNQLREGLDWALRCAGKSEYLPTPHDIVTNIYERNAGTAPKAEEDAIRVRMKARAMGIDPKKAAEHLTKTRQQFVDLVAPFLPTWTATMALAMEPTAHHYDASEWIPDIRDCQKICLALDESCTAQSLRIAEQAETATLDNMMKLEAEQITIQEIQKAVGALIKDVDHEIEHMSEVDDGTGPDSHYEPDPSTNGDDTFRHSEEAPEPVDSASDPLEQLIAEEGMFDDEGELV